MARAGRPLTGIVLLIAAGGVGGDFSQTAILVTGADGMASSKSL